MASSSQISCPILASNQIGSYLPFDFFKKGINISPFFRIET
ncbi:hypothetical protein C3B79_0498 [Aeromonas hydrophila]|nr:hypothetical protein C3B79_0498 [Aeromonas hydrophila]